MNDLIQQLISQYGDTIVLFIIFQFSLLAVKHFFQHLRKSPTKTRFNFGMIITISVIGWWTYDLFDLAALRIPVLVGMVIVAGVIIAKL